MSWLPQEIRYSPASHNLWSLLQGCRYGFYKPRCLGFSKTYKKLTVIILDWIVAFQFYY